MLLLLPRTGRVLGGSATVRQYSSPVRVLMVCFCAGGVPVRIAAADTAAIAIAVEDAREAVATIDDERRAPSSACAMAGVMRRVIRGRVVDQRCPIRGHRQCRLLLLLLLLLLPQFARTRTSRHHL